jgi:hypothetical protein
MNNHEIYEALAAEFPHTYQDVRSGTVLTYVTGEQVISRLNEVLGCDAWDLKVLQHGQDAEEVWVLAELTARIGDRVVIRHGFGGAKLRRTRDTRQVLDLGDTMKAAQTDAVKKAAQSLGVALYLARRPTPAKTMAGTRR